MKTRADLVQDRALSTEKALGSLLGVAVGDAMGDIARTDSYRQRYGIITNLYAGAKSTDDTEFALLTARTLIDNQGHLTPEIVLDSWKRYILDQGGVYERGGRPLYGAVENLKRGILPPLSGQFISTIKDSAIVSVISIQELTFQGLELMASTHLTFEIWITITGLYLLLTLSCALAVDRLEIRFGGPVR